MINGISQHIARVERAWHKALDALQKLQDRRRKEAALTPTEKPAEPPKPTLPPESQAKNDNQSQQCGDQAPRKEVGSRANGGNEAAASLPREAPGSVKQSPDSPAALEDSKPEEAVVLR